MQQCTALRLRELHYSLRKTLLDLAAQVFSATLFPIHDPPAPPLLPLVGVRSADMDEFVAELRRILASGRVV